jgi:hypothetical protein
MARSFRLQPRHDVKPPSLLLVAWEVIMTSSRTATSIYITARIRVKAFKLFYFTSPEKCLNFFYMPLWKPLWILLILLKAAHAVIKGFLKAVSSHMNTFRRPTEIDNFPRFINTVSRSFWTLITVAISSFEKLFYDSIMAFKILFYNRIWILEHQRLLVWSRKRFHTSAIKKFSYF